MTNFEYYKTPYELNKAYDEHCRHYNGCEHCPFEFSANDCHYDFAYAEHKEGLKPCPFCGGRPFVSDYESRFNDGYRVSCEKCFIATPYGERDKVIKMWNERVYENKKEA